MATNSWSGLNAVGDDKLDDLENSVELLRGLNTLDWIPILNDLATKYDNRR